jgi:hypothetical protein
MLDLAVFTVAGLRPRTLAGMIDAHWHAWIEPLPRVAAKEIPVFDERKSLARELVSISGGGGRCNY